MTTPNLTPDLQRDEGFDLDAYGDPLTGAAPWTIGYGHTGPDVAKGTVWTQAQADQALANDIATAEGALDAQLPWWRTLDDLRQDCLVNMCFNMGIGTLVQFNTFLGYMQGGDYAAAADDLAGTAWYGQVGQRAARIQQQILTDVHEA
jgi:lysozyme